MKLFIIAMAMILPMSAQAVKKITSAEAAHIIRTTKKPVVIDFYADWCGPCRNIAPVVEALEVKYKGKIDFYKVDIDAKENKDGPISPRSIPTFLFVKDPEVGPSILVGGNKDALIEKVEDLLK